MECGKFPKVLSPVPGALAKMELSTHNTQRHSRLRWRNGNCKGYLAVTGKASSQRLNSWSQKKKIIANIILCARNTVNTIYDVSKRPLSRFWGLPGFNPALGQLQGAPAVTCWICDAPAAFLDQACWDLVSTFSHNNGGGTGGLGEWGGGGYLGEGEAGGGRSSLWLDSLLPELGEGGRCGGDVSSCCCCCSHYIFPPTVHVFAFLFVTFMFLLRCS